MKKRHGTACTVTFLCAPGSGFFFFSFALLICHSYATPLFPKRSRARQWERDSSSSNARCRKKNKIVIIIIIIEDRQKRAIVILSRSNKTINLRNREGHDDEQVVVFFRGNRRLAVEWRLQIVVLSPRRGKETYYLCEKWKRQFSALLSFFSRYTRWASRNTSFECWFVTKTPRSFKRSLR